MMQWLANLFRKSSPPTHQIDLNGVHGFVMRLSDNGRKATVSGWNDDHWEYEEGHLVQLITKRTPEGNHGGTYRIDKVRHCCNPPDMYFIDCTFVGAQR
jgi:hypothetical protein